VLRQALCLEGPSQSVRSRSGRLVNYDPTRISWDRGNFRDIANGVRYSESDRSVLETIYRPFHRRWSEAGSRLNNDVYQTRRIFPTQDATTLAIAVPDPGGSADFSVTITSSLADSKLLGAGNAAQLLALRLYDSADTGGPGSLFGDQPPHVLPARHNVTDHALGLYVSLDPVIEKDDVFFYVYGILHSPDYRTAFAADLRKSLPRIPQVPTAEDFWAFANSGRELAQLHTEYEAVEPWPELKHVFAAGFDKNHPDAYRVLKMKHPKITDSAIGSKVEDRTRIIYNDWITIQNIPERAYEYELGSRSAIAWVMEAWRVRTDKASGIVNDPNDWAIEHDDPTYILDLVGRVVTVSMRTLEIVEGLPTLDL
jgi:predicted helicase